MRDWSGLVLFCATVFAGLLYAARVLRRGRLKTDRLKGVGGGLLGRGLLEAAYWTVGPATRACLALGLSPNQLTWLSVLIGAAAGVAVATGRLGIAAVLATASAVCDILDGEVARALKTSSDAGEVLDAAADRYTEFFFLGGAAVLFHENIALLCLALAALLAAFMVSYSTAKAEAMKVPPPGGAMRRHERSFFLIAGAAFSPVFPATFESSLGHVFALPLVGALLLVAIVGNASAARRLYLTARRLEPPAPHDEPGPDLEPHAKR